MPRITLISAQGSSVVVAEPQQSLFEALRQNDYAVYAPCGGKGTCGKCRLEIKDVGFVVACQYKVQEDITVILPEQQEANIVSNQSRLLANYPIDISPAVCLNSPSYGVAIDIGTTTLVLYILNLDTGKLEQIIRLLNPQQSFGGDVISRIQYCQENEQGLVQLQNILVSAINKALQGFVGQRHLTTDNLTRLVVAGNTSMLHILLKADPVPLSLAPFTPQFTERQERMAYELGFSVHRRARLITLPCLSAYVGADIMAGLSVLDTSARTYLFVDIGTNGEMALVKDNQVYACATAAGPAFEGANISCGMAAVDGAVSIFKQPDDFHVIGQAEAKGLCGSALIDVVAYLFGAGLLDESGYLEQDFTITDNITINQQDIRELQLGKSAIYSGLSVLLSQHGLCFDDVEALYLAGGFGNYVNTNSAISIGLLPKALSGRIYPVGNSAGIGALQYLKSQEFAEKNSRLIDRSHYIELSGSDDFNMAFALNMFLGETSG